MGYYSFFVDNVSSVWMEISLDGCEDCFLKWLFEREYVHEITKTICSEGSRT